jgi:predicted alpha/beta superfamily hydrolase
MVHVTGPYEIVPGFPPKRHVRIYVPRRAPARDRPFVLLFDGQNVFDDAPSFAGGWRAHRSIERLSKSVEPPVIIGVDHGHEHRIAELSPFDFGPHRGDAERFLHWISSWLLPKLRREHHLTHDPRRAFVGGSSMGGLASLYAALRLPDVFGGALSMSPSLFVGRGAIFDWVKQHGAPRGSRIYLDAGAHEAGGRMLASAERMAQLLGKTGAELRFRPDPHGHHREASWRRRFLPAVRYLLG